MTHAHEILHMMEGNHYASKEALIEAIIARFGTEERFHTCSVEGLDAAGIVDFLEQRGKFMPASSEAFTVDITKVCNH
ncbi:MAG: YecH family metal-binding protein [Alloprevotella sp.]|nr:YecH family protein [Bacteroidales bacterium]MDY3944210.1 YecH family metal-binding protein [Alloprevotella sp.]